MQQNNRDKDSIQNTILHWPSDYSNNLKINNIWKVLPGFLTWTIWKERNKRIFQNDQRNLEFSQLTLTENVHQLILEKCSAVPDSQLSARDQYILQIFKLDNGHNISTASSQQEPRTGPFGWHRPPVGFLKLNFDGASRGNPGLVGIGGVIRNHKGEIPYIYSRALGEVIEGDSEVAITAARKIYRGTPASRVTKHWRLAQETNNIAKMLEEMKGLTFQAIRCKGNTVADHLTNFGIEHPNARWDS
eukprot:PITA_02977